MRKNKNGLPERWLAYSNAGDRVEGTRFIAFKVPLGENFLYHLRTNQRFGPRELIDSQPELGLVIDLTNTHRYYSPESVQSNGVRYCKLAIPGRMVPTERLVRRFCDIVLEFLSSDAPPDALIGVHCTHGVNRTGYLICSFMIRHLLMNPREAVVAFETARGHRIERQEYVEALVRQHQRFGRKGPRRTPPREQSGAYDSDTGASNELYDGERARSSAWARRVESASEPWKSSYQGPWAPAQEPEAGPSRKRAPNEPLQPSPRGTRKGKRDKRPRNNQAASTSGTEGEDCRADSRRVAGLKREAPSHDRPLPQGSSDASRNRDPPMRYGGKNGRRCAVSKRRPSALGCAPEALQNASNAEVCESRENTAAAAAASGPPSPPHSPIHASLSFPGPKSVSTYSSKIHPFKVSVQSRSAHSGAPPPSVSASITATPIENAVSPSTLDSLNRPVSISLYVSVPTSRTGSVTARITPANVATALSDPLSAPCLSASSSSPSPSTSPHESRSPSPFPSPLPSRSLSPLYSPMLYASSPFGSPSFPRHTHSESRRISPDIFWRYSVGGSPIPSTSRFDNHQIDPTPRGGFLHADLSDNDSSLEYASSSSWGSWPGSNRAASDMSYDYSLGPKYDIECVPHYETDSEIEYDPEFAPSLSLESGLSPDLSDMDLEAVEDDLLQIEDAAPIAIDDAEGPPPKAESPPSEDEQSASDEKSTVHDDQPPPPSPPPSPPPPPPPPPPDEPPLPP